MKIKKAVSIAVLLALLCSIAIPAATAEGETIHISTAEELSAFAQSCTLDGYSEGLTVVLDNDIDLTGVEFYPIPTFSGTFEGGGFTISNMITATNGSHQGLFRYIRAEGTVKNLNVTGTVTPESNQCQVGGIAGTNCGTIVKCSFNGTVSGMNYVGGIAGENCGAIRACTVEGKIDGKRFTGGVAGSSTGMISTCSSTALVNTSITEGGIDLNELSLSDITTLDLTNAEDTDVVSDSGGIVGFNTGKVMNCENRGTIGYQHYGYNVGGIAGRQSGYISSCSNFGEIYGRKDVGGIVGQMEPFLLLKNSVSLSSELALLHNLVVQAMSNVADMSDQMQSTLVDVDSNATAAQQSLNGAESASAYSESAPVQSEPEAGADGASPEAAAYASTMSESGTGDRGEAGGDISGGDSGGNSGDITISDDLQNNLNQMAGGMNQMASIIGASSGALAEDMVAVNDQLARVIMLMANALSGIDLDIIEDVSDTLKEDDLDGKVASCVNYGQVDSDKNAGGIAGAMGIEYEFDLDGALASALSKKTSIISNTYESKCVNVDNVNRGSVVAKKDDAGGVTGLVELGTILRCEGYGSVSSTEGSYVGGIVGYTGTPVRSCYAMCNIDGTQYVGGIAGYGTTIDSCGSLVGIKDMTVPFCGAIAGWVDVSVEDSITNNSFVQETLGAVDGISYAGRAEASSYEQFLKREDLPDQFKKLRLSFVADGNTVAEVEFTYGGTIDPSSIPEVPQKEGYSGEWPDYDYSRLYFSDTIEAVYTPKQPTIAAKNQRADSPMSILLLEGDFEDTASVSLNSYNGEGPTVENGNVLEKWVMRLNSPDDAGETYTVRFLPPEVTQKGGRIELFVLKDDQWSRIGTGTNGSYLTFENNADTLVFCAAETEETTAAWAIGAGAAAILVIAALLIWNKSRKKKKAAAAEQSETAGQPSDDAAEQPDIASQETADPVSAEDPAAPPESGGEKQD